MKKLLLTTAFVAMVTSTAFAEDKLKVSIGGSLDSQIGYRSQKGEFKNSDPNSAQPAGNKNKRLSNNSIVNSTDVNVNIEGEAENGIKYGGLIKINADTSDSKKYFGEKKEDKGIAEQTMAFMETQYGRVEIGSYTGVGEAMKVNAANFASATGGIDGDSQFWWNRNADSLGLGSRTTRTQFLQTPNLPTNELGIGGVKIKNAAKVNLYSPEYAGFRVGVAYAPDLKSHGTIGKVGQVMKNSSDRDSFKHLIEAGISYTGKFDDVGVKTSVVGQYAKPKSKMFSVAAKNDSGQVISTEYNKQRKLQAWEAGVNLTYRGFAIGGSYGDWGKTGQYKATQTVSGSGAASNNWANMKGTKTSYWTAGVGYGYGPFTTSLTYFESKLGQEYDASSSKTKQNKLRNIVLGADYKMAPGFMPYVEVSAFKMTDNLKGNNGEKAKSNKGNIFLTGVKLNF